jgi:asparagine synthase (glutamine-hydrolysing)
MALREHTSRWEVACGISIALPYLDDDLVHFLARVPSEAVFAGARERGLLREAMEGLVPDSVRYRMDKAVPYEAFIETFEGAGGPKSVSDLLTMSELSHGGVVDASAFRGQFEQFMRNPRAHPHDWVTLWPAITAEAFLRWFREHRQGADERWPG